jgi:hypothetical protein
VALLALHAQETVLESPALEIRIELPLNVFRQRPAGRLAGGEKRWVMRFDELIEERLLGPVPRIARWIDERGRTSRRLTAACHSVASLRSTVPLRLCGAAWTAASQFPGATAGFAG